jgi:hypothetical protein
MTGNVPGIAANCDVPSLESIFINVSKPFFSYFLVSGLFRYETGKTILVTGRGGPHGYETSRLPHFLHNRLADGGEVVSPTCRPPFTPGRFLVLISVRR